MGFEDIEQQLKLFFFRTQKKDAFPKLQADVLEAFVDNKPPFWKQKFLLPTASAYVFAFIGIFALMVFSTGISEKAYAGTILPKFGPVEIIRDGKMLLVKENTNLHVGDSVRIGNRAEANILLANQLHSTAKTRTTFRVERDKSIFLEQGELENKSYQRNRIITERGIIESTQGAYFLVSVSESGEAKIITEKKGVRVFDLNNRKIALEPGDELSLRTDTILPEYDIPNDLRLSVRQLRAIRSKLEITRSKIITGAEHLLNNKREKAEKDFISAEKTFRSIAQILHTSRALRITKRKNLEKINIANVLPLLRRKVNDEYLLSEVKALENLLVILDKNKQKIAFSPENTGVESYDRFVTLKRLFALGTNEQKALGSMLLQKYVVAFLRKVQNEELRIDKITILNEQITKLPKNPDTLEFLERTMALFSPDIAEILGEKIEKVF